MKIEDLQNAVRSAVAETKNPLLREAVARYDIQVALHRVGKRDVRSDADASYFDPQQQEIGIRFVKRDQAARIPSPPPPEPAAVSVAPVLVSTSLDVLIGRLNDLENDAQVSFVGLKWFRDVILRKAGLSDADARATLDRAIKSGLVIVQKLMNPHSPFATSTLRLNREAPEVKAMFAAGKPAPPRRGFAPLDIPGLNLSDEVIRSRR